jgi:hypothetical protein
MPQPREATLRPAVRLRGDGVLWGALVLPGVDEPRVNNSRNLLADTSTAVVREPVRTPTAREEQVMRRQLLAMASSAALGVAISMSGPAGAIQLTPGLGNAADANVIQVRDRGNDGGRGGASFSGRGGGGGSQMSIRSGGDSGRGMSRGNFSAPRANFQARGQVNRGDFRARGQVDRGDFKRVDRSDFRARGQVNRDNFNRRDFNRGDRGDIRARGQVQSREIQRDVQRRELQRERRDINRNDGNKDYSRWKGNHPRLSHRGWDRHHKHRFFGAFLIGVPFGYAAISANPCYDWVYGPQGWGYYWNYDRCPV